MSLKAVILIWSVFVSALCTGRIEAQSGAAELEVAVLDPAHLAVVGASVKVVDEERGRERSGKTATDGSVRLLGLQPGLYRITASFGDFQPTDQLVRLQTGSRATASIELALARQGETLEVRAEQPVLETGRGSVSTVVDETLVEGLPLDGRNFGPLVATLPGVALPRGSAFPRLNGSRPRTNEYIYDGVSVL